MTDEQAPETEALQAVVDRVSAYQDGAPEGTVEAELRKGIDEAGLETPDEHISSLVAAIEENQGNVDVAQVLG